MESCGDIGLLVTRVADGEATADERARVDGHLRTCAPCQRQMHAEREVRELVRERADVLVGHAPLGLHARCGAARAALPSPTRRPALLLSRASWPMALAAALVLAVTGAAVVGVVVNPSKAVAAQLTLDHLKCFALFEEPAGVAPGDVQATLKTHGIDIPVPTGLAASGLTLVGGRRCVYLDGFLVHLLYRKGPFRVSLFVLPTGAKLSQTELDALGHSAVAFTKDGRTWVVLGRVPHADLEATASAFSAVSN